jgi:hypothetical protein
MTEPFHNKHMKWEQWFETCGRNQNAVLAFNDGAFTRSSIEPIAPGYDYLSGEAVVLIDGK